MKPPLSRCRMGYDFLCLRAQSSDAKFDLIADIEPDRFRLDSHSDPRRCTRCDDVAGQQRHVATHIRDQGFHTEDHRPGITGLPAPAVDVEPQFEVLRITDLVGGYQPRSDGSESVAALTLVPLRGLHLKRAFGD